MATLTAWKFQGADSATQAVATLQSLQKQELIQIIDAATIRWPEGAKKPKIQQLNNLAGAGALSGAFWGMLFGLIFLVPFLGAAIGAASGALAGAFADVGIDDGFIKGMRDKVTPGTSALVVLSQNAVIDRVQEAFAGTNPELIASNMSADQERQLREAFQEEA